MAEVPQFDDLPDQGIPKFDDLPDQEKPSAHQPDLLGDIQSGQYGGALAAIYKMFTAPSWWQQASEQSRRDQEAFARGGVPELMCDTETTQDLATGFQPLPLHSIKIIAPIVQEFTDTVMAQAAVRLDAYGRTGSPDGVKLDMPIAGTKPEPPIVPPRPASDIEYRPAVKIQGKVFEGSNHGDAWERAARELGLSEADIDKAIDGFETDDHGFLTREQTTNIERLGTAAPMRRSEAALTGDPVVDMVLNHPVTNVIIDRPIIDRAHDVPYMAGGSEPLANPTVYIDKHVPRSQTVGGITFDPADPWTVHENVEQTVMDTLIKNNMAPEQAYRTAHFGWAEPAEQAWYRAHGIDQVAAEAEQAKWLPRIQHEPPVDIPRDLYDKPYPDSQPGRAHDEAIAEQQPTPGEMSLARDIIRNAPELQPRSAQPMLQQARDLGVIGPGKPSPPAGETPAVAAQRAMPSARRPDDKITMTPAGEPIDAWEKRFNQWVDKTNTPDDFKDLIRKAAQDNNNFPVERSGSVPADQIDKVAQLAGLDAAKIDGVKLRTEYRTDDEIRVVLQTMQKLAEDVQKTAADVRTDASPENLEKFQIARMKRDYGLEALVKTKVAMAAEWGRGGNALQLILQAEKQQAKITGVVGKHTPSEPGERPSPQVLDLVGAAKKFEENAQGEKPLELDKLIKAAQDLVEQSTKQPKTPGEKPPPVPAAVKELIKTSEAVVNLMKLPKTGEPPDLSVRPLRQLVRPGEEPSPTSPLARFNALVSDAERNVTAGVKAGKNPSEALSPELRELVNRAKDVSEFFGGAGLNREVESLLAKKAETPDDLIRMAKSLDGLSVREAARALTEQRSRRPAWYYYSMMQGLISGVITHAYYAGVNLAWMEFNNVLAPGVQAILDRTPGLRNPDPILFGEVYAAQRAIITSLPDAIAAAKQAFRTGMRPPFAHELGIAPESTRYAYNQPIGPDNWGFLERFISPENLTKYVSVPGRSASALHTTFANLSYFADIAAQAHHIAAGEGLSARTQAFADRTAYLKANPTPDMVTRSVQRGLEGTFMQELGEVGQKFNRLVKDSPLKWVMFFTHIPINIAKGGVEITAPFLDRGMRADLMGSNGQSAQNLAFAKWTLGGSLMSYFVYQGVMDKATGSYPIDPDTRRQWQFEHRQENSIDMGGHWISVARMGPFGIAAKLGADIGHILKNLPDDYEKQGFGDTLTNAMGHMSIAAANAFLTEAGFQGLANIMDMIEGHRTPSEWASYQGATYLQPITFLSQAASAADPNMREAKGLIEGLMMRLPGLRQMLPVKRDPLYGNPLPNPGYAGSGGAGLVRMSPEADPIKMEMEKVGYFPGYPNKALGGVHLTREQYEKYQATAGPLVHDALTDLVNSPGWHDLPAGDRRKDLEGTVKSMRQEAASAIQADEPELIEAGIDRQDRFLETGSRKQTIQHQ